MIGPIARRAAAAVFTLLLVVGFTHLSTGRAAASSTYDAAYAGESIFTSVGPGESGQMSAIFFNSGTQAWAPGVVALLVCAADKVTCNVESPNVAYARDWYSATAYATVLSPVLPGQNEFFVYSFNVPVGALPGTTVTFNGDVGLTANGAPLHPSGYYQQNTVAKATGLWLRTNTDADPIGADAISTAAITATVVGPDGRADVAYSAGTLTLTRAASSANVCRFTDVTGGRSPAASADGSSVTVDGEYAQVIVTSTTFPGICSVTVLSTNIPLDAATVSVTTKIVGPATRLGVSVGASSSHPASSTGACTVAGVAEGANDDASCTVVSVDVQDINGNRIASDTRSVVSARLDSATCGGSAGGVNIASVAGVPGTSATATVSRGRATFVLASPSLAAGCRITFTAAGLASTGTTETWTTPASSRVSSSVAKI